METLLNPYKVQEVLPLMPKLEVASIILDFVKSIR